MNDTTKRLLLNHQIFMEKLLANPEFFLEILTWKKRLQITKADLGDFFNTNEKIRVKARKYGIKLMEKIVKDDNVDFISWLSDFCLKYQLASTWKQSLIDYIACGYYCPPATSLTVTVDQQKEIVVIELGADTSKEEFNRAWNSVKEAQKAFPQKTKRRFSEKSFASLEMILKSNRIRNKHGLKGLDLIADLYSDDGKSMEDIPSKETDKKRLQNLKIQRQRANRRGYIKRTKIM